MWECVQKGRSLDELRAGRVVVKPPVDGLSYPLEVEVASPLRVVPTTLGGGQPGVEVVDARLLAPLILAHAGPLRPLPSPKTKEDVFGAGNPNADK